MTRRETALDLGFFIDRFLAADDTLVQLQRCLIEANTSNRMVFENEHSGSTEHLVASLTDDALLKRLLGPRLCTRSAA